MQSPGVKNMTTAQPARSRRAPVESVPLVLTPQLLRIPRSPDHSAALLWPSLGAQLRFQVELAGDGIPVKINIPRQPLTFSPPRWVPEQTVRVLSDFINHPSSLRRRYWFCCPRRTCRRPVTALFLFLDSRQSRFLCRHCLSLPSPSDSISSYTYLAAKDPFCPNLSLRVQLRALAVWYRWRTEGKGKKGTLVAGQSR
jgi:hypothetical protein